MPHRAKLDSLPPWKGSALTSVWVVCEELQGLLKSDLDMPGHRSITLYCAEPMPNVMGSTYRSELETLLTTHHEIEHVAFCLHDNCKHFSPRTGRANAQASQDFSDKLHSIEVEIMKDYPELSPEVRRGFIQHHWLRRMLPEERLWHRMRGHQQLQLHGLIYETETNWLSALDQETGLFVPLNAYSASSPWTCNENVEQETIGRTKLR